MANEKKVASNGHIDVVWIPVGGIANPAAPTKAEIEAGIYLSPAIAWDNFELAPSDSNDTDDRSIVDAANATTRGYAQYGATLPMFREGVVSNAVSDYAVAFETFRPQRIPGWLILRTNVAASKTFTAGDVISVFKFIADYVTDDTEGEDSIKYQVNFIPQGELYVNTQVANSTNVSVAPDTLSVAVGAVGLVKATIGGRNYTQGVTWTSSANNIATVSPNGVVNGVAAGTATITATHPAAGSGTGNVSTVTVTAS